uniref:tissue factor pathway inhibitor 2 isoform X2 n=1 Tax=Pristiophorus japonicus TaxID=55135 RepID=UPI00398F2A0F
MWHDRASSQGVKSPLDSADPVPPEVPSHSEESTAESTQVTGSNKMMELTLFTMICGIFLVAPLSGTPLEDNREVCLQPRDVGPCKALLSRFYYNGDSQMCEKFYYGGCYGNENNFNTLKECSLHCGRIKKIPPKCRLEPEVGPCRAALIRYFFNFIAGQCEEFVFGGCHGNLNNFKDMTTCQQYCKPISIGPSFCHKPKDEGSCSADIPRYYFNQETDTCETFSYTGCGGNDNNFISLSACQKICQPGDKKVVKNKKVPAAPANKIIKKNRRIKFLKNPKIIN